ncbi:hypothetical protein GH714_028213 [Hevea brasiliensis]|uniref:Reverse transcriptase Ty1/copia-type domain-containing protein n=1 Tax=Hevea brasiliensis TaxID=3981 RepID=A0A6A6LGV2_HEVBR|nr:hypothetical protein GH714_028213 [Hevea brasiliensis]
MKDLGATKKILEMEITRDRSIGKLFLSPQAYVEKVLKRFNMNNAKPMTIPFAANFKLSADMSLKTDEEMEHMSSVPYSSTVGSIIYAMVCTQPDVSHAVSIVSRYMVCPRKEYWQVVKWILRYLKGTIDIGLTLDMAKISDLVVGYGDSDRALRQGKISNRDCCYSQEVKGIEVEAASFAVSRALEAGLSFLFFELDSLSLVHHLKSYIFPYDYYGTRLLHLDLLSLQCSSFEVAHMFLEANKNRNLKFVEDFTLVLLIITSKTAQTSNPESGFGII